MAVIHHEQHIPEHLAYMLLERMAKTTHEQHIPEILDPWVRMSESHSRRTSPAQVYGSRDSLLVGHRSEKQLSIISRSLTGSGAP